MKKYIEKLKRLNPGQALIDGFKSIGEGMSHITLFPSRYSKLNMDEYQNSFERDKKSLEEDWKKLSEDWKKVCPFE